MNRDTGYSQGPTYLVKEKGAFSLSLQFFFLFFFLSFFLFFFYLITKARLKENFWQVADTGGGGNRNGKMVAKEVAAER